MKKIVIAGGNGFLGKYLAGFFHEKGWSVCVIARRDHGVEEHSEYVYWDGITYEDSWARAIDGADLVVNMAGKSVNCRYSEANKKAIFDSRTQTTELIGRAIGEAENPPDLWDRHAEDRPQGDYDGELGSGFSVEVAKRWENAFFNYPLDGCVRKIAVRTALVLAKEKDTVYDVLSGLCRKYLGGTMGSGKQMVSWVHVEDFCRAILYLYVNEQCSGVYNLAAPNPLRNKNFMQVIRELNGVKWGLPATAWMLELGAFFMRTETELILKSRWVLPTRLLQEGFKFHYHHVNEMDIDK